VGALCAFSESVTGTASTANMQIRIFHELGVSQQMAKRDLEKLANEGVLVVDRAGRSTVYKLIGSSSDPIKPISSGEMNRRIDIMKIPKLSDNNKIDQFAAICGTVAPVLQVFR
jgi:predicted ArsR family transcriptional regulator